MLLLRSFGTAILFLRFLTCGATCLPCAANEKEEKKMKKIIVTEKISDKGIALLKAQKDLQVDVEMNLSGKNC